MKSVSVNILHGTNIDLTVTLTKDRFCPNDKIYVTSNGEYDFFSLLENASKEKYAVISKVQVVERSVWNRVKFLFTGKIL